MKKEKEAVKWKQKRQKPSAVDELINSNRSRKVIQKTVVSKWLHLQNSWLKNLFKKKSMYSYFGKWDLKWKIMLKYFEHKTHYSDLLWGIPSLCFICISVSHCPSAAICHMTTKYNGVLVGWVILYYHTSSICLWCCGQT